MDSTVAERLDASFMWLILSVLLPMHVQYKFKPLARVVVDLAVSTDFEFAELLSAMLIWFKWYRHDAVHTCAILHIETKSLSRSQLGGARLD